jgi:hypothetical protein
MPTGVYPDERTAGPCKTGCGATVQMSKRGPAAMCKPCWKAARRDVSQRYRQRQKARPDFERPFLREQHGMTELDYAQMLVAQNGRCAGCDRAAPVAGKNLHIDHDHRCCPQGGRSCARCRRGLLCAECNMALGLLADDPTRLENLAAYLRKWGGDQHGI